MKRNARDNAVIEMKNAFDGLISRLGMAEKRISELEDVNRNFQNGKAKSKKTKTNKQTKTRYRISKCLQQ